MKTALEWVNCIALASVSKSFLSAGTFLLQEIMTLQAKLKPP
jgi:hypothetical protein